MKLLHGRAIMLARTVHFFKCEPKRANFQWLCSLHKPKSVESAGLWVGLAQLLHSYYQWFSHPFIWDIIRRIFLGPTYLLCQIIPVLLSGIIGARDKPHTLPGVPAQWSTGEMYVPICDLLLWHLPGPITLSSRIHPSIKSSNTAVFHVSEMEVQGRSVITLSWCHCLPFDGQMTLGLCVEVAAFEKHGKHIRYVKGI